MPKIELVCAKCTRTFERYKSQINAKYGYYFCSSKCKNASMIGEGIIPRPNRWKQYSPQHPSYWQRKLKASNESKCESCSEDRQFLLIVHHIDGNRKNNEARNIEILCFNCHGTRHLKLVDGVWTYDSHVLTPRHKLKELLKL